MFSFAAHRKDRLIAFAAVLGLLLQTFFASMAFAVPQSGGLDAFGNPLCISGADHGSSPTDHPSRTPNCCTFGCSMSSTVLGQPSAEPLAPVPGVKAAIQPRDNREPPQLRTWRGPGSPRAPPLTT